MALDTSDPNAVHKAAQDILSQAQFEAQRQTLWDQIFYYVTHPIDFLALVLTWIADRFLAVAGGNVVVASIAAIVMAVVVVAVVVRFTRTTSASRSVRVHYAPKLSGESVKQMLDRAAAFENDGHWRDAIHMRYAALIQKLGDDGLLRVRSGRTTGEYSQEITTNAPGVASEFTSATRIFEWVWYGNGKAGAGDLHEFKAFAKDALAKVSS